MKRLNKKFWTVLAIFGLPRAIQSMGGAEKFKEAMEYLEGVLKELGYTGLITMTSGEPSDEVYKAGITAVYAYNWGHQSYSFEYTKARILQQTSATLLVQANALPSLALTLVAS